MTDSQVQADRPAPRAKAPGKRERLITAAAQVFHEQGVEKTTLGDIARAADVPVGNVYYYFKTKDQLVEAAIGAHAQQLQDLTALLDQLPTPQDRLKALVGGWVGQRDLAARFGCPFGTLASELDKRDDGLDQAAATVMRLLIDWTERQFRAMGHDDARDLAVTMISAYQGMSLLTNTLRDPDLMTTQGARLQGWIDSLA
ncbi:TetR/AcrR family transcriptional regulator [Streptomyces scopuliridis]|uniref:TetR/AcrR family transcriptional regulator n=1 Tax=Streptomyces scopuliridis TaxID=452529 RepID=A0ACD4ZI51_9ACTN|nr:TetR/AcrR family transcriptional regulator [Streptomyces scopuliridis]WSB98135.1 TetR/AcrR family transcriptional regulator [Streptomyces scopuliridis]WSC08163.1 TetR/AcrR family transcriptional regulator [Streptomyces scopuliridis]